MYTLGTCICDAYIGEQQSGDRKYNTESYILIPDTTDIRTSIYCSIQYFTV